jgi:hypothetical protein
MNQDDSIEVGMQSRAVELELNMVDHLSLRKLASGEENIIIPIRLVAM